MGTLTRQIARLVTGLLGAFAFVAIAALPGHAAPYAAYVMDARTGETLYEVNSGSRLHPASLTKMMTLYIAFDAIERGEISLDTMVTVSKHAASQPPSRLGLRAGQRIALRHLIRAAAIKSANDAATAIGEALSGDEARFAQRMTRTAKALGMRDSTFKNANGLTAAGHLSTARDMSVLGRRLFYDFPQYYSIFSRRTADAGVAQVANTNRRFLDGYSGADGIKTGYTVAAGFNLTASAERGGKRVIATVFGGTSTAQRNAKMAELMDIGFGKAPRRARETPPDAVVLPDEDDLLAEAVANDVAKGVAAGKTIRLSTRMQTSPRPRFRPVGGAAVALAQVPAPAADAAAAEAVMGVLQDSIDSAVAEAAAPEPLPFAVVDGDGSVIADAGEVLPDIAPTPGAAPAGAVAGVDVPALRPTGRPQADTAAVDLAANDPAQALPDELALAGIEDMLAPLPEVAESSVLPMALLPDQTMPSGEEGTMLSAEAAAGLPQPEAPAAAIPETVAPNVEIASAAPMPMLLLPLPTEAPPEAEGEVVTRLSTSGGRSWGVSLGQQSSRGAAERLLTRVLLSESIALGEGLRKVVQRSGGYDATVMGLTEDQAALACARLAARASTCVVVAPGT